MTASRPGPAPKHVRWKEEEIIYSFEYESDEADTSVTSDDSTFDRIPEDVDLLKDGSRIDSTGSSGVYHVRRRSVQDKYKGRWHLVHPSVQVFIVDDTSILPKKRDVVRVKKKSFPLHSIQEESPSEVADDQSTSILKTGSRAEPFRDLLCDGKTVGGSRHRARESKKARREKVKSHQCLDKVIEDIVSKQEKKQCRKQLEDHRGTAFVELPKREGCGLGLVISGGADKDCTPRVSYLRPGGIAQRSDALEVGDYIVSVNGIKTAYLRHDEIVSLIKNAEESVILEVEYELPEPPHTTFSVICKRIEIRLRRDADTFGFTLRGGLHDDPAKCRPLTVTQIRPGSAADREGTLKVGDRILSIDGVNVMQCSLAESLAILKHSEDQTKLLVEYDVSVIDAVQNSQGPLLVEIDKTPGCSLGIDLAATSFKGQTVLCISQIEAASIADRCGALHVGDHILAIDDTSLEHMTVAEASQLLKSSMGELIRLEILPSVQLQDKSDRDQQPVVTAKPACKDNRKANLTPPDTDLGANSASMASLNSLQSFTTFNSMTTQVGSAIAPPISNVGSMNSVNLGSRSGTLRSNWANRNKRNNSDTCLYQGDDPPDLDELLDPDGQFTELWQNSENEPPFETQGQGCELSLASLASAGTYASVLIPHHQVCRTEAIEVTLIADHRGFGLILENGGCDTEVLIDPPIITFIEPRSAAERCGVIQEGDRILSINDVTLESKTLEEANQMLKESGVKVLMQVEFDIAESIIPSSGIFVVKLAKRGSGLGITINSPNNRKPGEPLLITDVRKGSVAHRTGTIQPGDRLLAIGNVRMDNCSLEDAAQVLQNSEDIVKLKIRKDETFADEPDPTTTITYTVELPKFGGPLGITISGTEEPFDPIYISSLAEGGLAEKTGALHVGDRILAINGQSLRGRPLPDAIQLLQNARDTVTLKITRPANQKSRNGVAGKSHDSVDSALESWDSSGLDSNNARMGPRSHEIQREGSGSSGVHSQDNQPCHTKGGGSTYCDLSNELHLEEEEQYDMQSPSVSAPPSCASDTDEWSKRLDELDHFSQAEVIHDADLESVHTPNVLSTNSNVRKIPSAPPVTLPRISSMNKADMTSQPSHSSPSLNKLSSTMHPDQNSLTSGSGSVSTQEADSHSASSSHGSGSGQVVTADMHLREVEEQLQNIFTPTPVELLKMTLERQRESESFGFSLSDGVYEKGVYISAIQPNGPAERQSKMRSFDRLLQVNHVRTKDLDCHQVVPLIARSGLKVHLVLSRNPLANTPISTPTSSPRSTLQSRKKGADLTNRPPRPGRAMSHNAPGQDPSDPRRRGQENPSQADEEAMVWKPQYGLRS